MKFYEEHFVDYVSNVNNSTLHPKLKTIYSKLPENIDDLPNLIFYGPSGVGKYSQALSVINKYSSTNLKYEKKLVLQLTKQTFNIKISDTHFEVDMELLGCNSKNNWNEIYSKILDIIESSKIHKGIILCKNFHSINNELLDVFYSYTQYNPDIKYVFLTTELSFIPDIILNKCIIINVPMYSKSLLKKNLKCKKTESSNIKYIKGELTELDDMYKPIYDRLLNIIKDYKNLSYSQLREIIYDILIYKNDINDVIWYVIKELINCGLLKTEKLGDVLFKTIQFFQLYNNNYRPIYHLENYFYYLVIVVHEL
tara:strand:+ start:4216 stop:5148 length:933 start_codon:yes stop_codon:yes gene_type:complete